MKRLIDIFANKNYRLYIFSIALIAIFVFASIFLTQTKIVSKTGFLAAVLQGVQSTPINQQSVGGDKRVDVSKLVAANLDIFNFHPTVTGIVETDTTYTVFYSIETLTPEGIEWTVSSKTGEFSVAKDALGDGGLTAYIVGKLHDIENRERSYLSRVQIVEKMLAEERQVRHTRVLTSIVGLELDEIPVPVIEKPAAPEPPSVSVQPPVLNTVPVVTLSHEDSSAIPSLTPTVPEVIATTTDSMATTTVSTSSVSEVSTTTLVATTDQSVAPSPNASSTATTTESTL